jgi:hypothetical protein
MGMYLQEESGDRERFLQTGRRPWRFCRKRLPQPAPGRARAALPGS